MASESLHPALAQIALASRKVLLAYSSGEISADVARARLGELVSRDDDGVLWTLDAGGTWLRRTKAGEWVPGTPPAYGLRPPTAEQLGGVPSQNGELVLIPIDEIAMGTLGSLVGLTRISGSGEEIENSALISGLRVFAMADRVLTSHYRHYKARLRGWGRHKSTGWAGKR